MLNFAWIFQQIISQAGIVLEKKKKKKKKSMQILKNVAKKPLYYNCDSTSYTPQP